MKKHKIIFFLILSSFFSIYSFAQDTIFFKNAGKIVVLVKEVSQTEIQYKKLELPDGPMYIVSKNDIEKIIYKNGYTETIKPSFTESSTNSTTISSAQSIIGYQKITYADAKSKSRTIYSIIDRHPDLNKQLELKKIYRSMRAFKSGQNANRTVSIVFGGLTIFSGAIVGLANMIDSNAGGYEVPAIFGSVALVTCAASITFHVNLRKKRQAFVNLYNE
jgi:hypothetical protein